MDYLIRNLSRIPAISPDVEGRFRYNGGFMTCYFDISLDGEIVPLPRRKKEKDGGSTSIWKASMTLQVGSGGCVGSGIENPFFSHFRNLYASAYPEVFAPDVCDG